MGSSEKTKLFTGSRKHGNFIRKVVPGRKSVLGQVVGRGDGGVCTTYLLIACGFLRNTKQEARKLSGENEVGEDRIVLRKR